MLEYHFEPRHIDNLITLRTYSVLLNKNTEMLYQGLLPQKAIYIFGTQDSTYVTDLYRI